jgi:guanylate kinase
MGNQQIVMLAGPSQIGKSAVIKELVDRFNWSFITTYTTRAPRSEEINGRDYHFLTQHQFQQLISANAFVDWDYFLGSYGGIGRRTFYQLSDRPKVLHVLARMAIRLEQRSRNAIAIFLAPEDVSLVHARIGKRFADPLVAKARLAHVEEEMLHAALFRKVVRIDATMSITDVAGAIQACLMK